SPEQIAKISPNTKTTPVFRSKQDALITEKVYQTSTVLIEKTKQDGDRNPWSIYNASTFFDMTRDSRFFFTASDLEGRGLVLEGNVWCEREGLKPKFLPLFESKMLHILDHRWSSSQSESDDEIGTDQSPKVDPHYE